MNSTKQKAKQLLSQALDASLPLLTDSLKRDYLSALLDVCKARLDALNTPLRSEADRFMDALDELAHRQCSSPFMPSWEIATCAVEIANDYCGAESTLSAHDAAQCWMRYFETVARLDTERQGCA